VVHLGVERQRDEKWSDDANGAHGC
jgi:hypothetical protein